MSIHTEGKSCSDLAFSACSQWLSGLALRYAFGAFPLAKTLGLSPGLQRFLHHTVGLATELPPNQLMSQLLGWALQIETRVKI
jgi:hypothetical protein